MLVYPQGETARHWRAAHIIPERQHVAAPAVCSPAQNALRIRLGSFLETRRCPRHPEQQTSKAETLDVKEQIEERVALGQFAFLRILAR
jgi:hypothetical protein